MNKFLDWLHEGEYPLTKAIILANVATLIASLGRLPVAQWLSFFAPDSLRLPWTLITYPLVSFDPIGLIFYGLMLWWVCGSLERSWGTRTFAIFFAAISVISALGIVAGVSLLRLGGIPVFNQLPLAALIVAWAMLNPNLEIRIYGIIPILAKWLAVGTALIVFFTHFAIHPLMGFFALGGCAASLWWVRNRGWREAFSYAYRAPQPRGPKPKRARRDDDFSLKDLNPLERIARARRKKKFQRLFEDDEK